MNLTVVEVNKFGKKRKIYKDNNSQLYLDCKHCGIALLSDFGDDKRGFAGKRSECTPCRRRTKDDRAKLGTRTTLVVEGEPVDVIYYLVSQARRFAFKDKYGEIYFICTKCNVPKYIDDFYLETGGLLDTKSTCKECTDKKNNEWIQENYEYYLEIQSNNYNDNKEERKKQRKEYREENKVYIKESTKLYREQNKNKIFFKKRNIEKGKERKKRRKELKNFLEIILINKNTIHI